MALLECPDCKRQVSDTAPACPGCGRPLQAAARSGPVEIEATSKGNKLAQFLGVVLLLIGMVSCMAAPPDDNTGPMLLAIGGLVLYIVGRVGAWWRNG